MRSVCSADGCVAFVKAHGLCDKHWQRLRNTGTIEGGPREPAPLDVRFWRQVQKRGPDECWLWLGATRPNGYGRIGAGGKGGAQLAVHRYSCELHHGPPPDGLPMCLHSCDNPPCVNPAHLRWGTGSENILEAYAKGRKQLSGNVFRKKE